MLVEVTTAARYWAQQLQLSQPTSLSVLPLEPSQVSVFENELMAALQERYASHWYESNPIKGQAYRSILADFENGLIDDVLLLAASRAHISDLAAHLPRQNGLRMWCDPGEVSVEPIRGRSRELVLYRARSGGRRSATATGSKAAAGSSGALSASAAPFQSRRSPPLVATAAPFSTRGLYTAADHERLVASAAVDEQSQQVYYSTNNHALSTPALYDASAWSAPADASAMYHHHRHASTGGSVGLYQHHNGAHHHHHHHHHHSQKQLAAF